jgi:hypothetical protein
VKPELLPSGLSDSVSDVRALVCIAIAFVAASAAQHLYRRNQSESRSAGIGNDTGTSNLKEPE